MNKDNGLYIRVSSELKEAFQKVVEHEGYNVSETIEASMRDVCRRGYVPLYLKSNMKPRIERMLSIPEIKDILDRIVSKYSKKVKRVSLFGSYAKGTATKKRDIDLFVEADNDFGLFEQVELEKRLKEHFKKDVDLVSGSTSKSFLNQMMRERIVLYERRA